MVYTEEYLKEKLTKELDAVHVVSMNCQILLKCLHVHGSACNLSKYE